MDDFNLLIIKWYRQNKRNLPWRITKDPYKIWLSEVILQQTKVSQGLDYYVKFCNNYPTVFDLAKANEQNILSDWQGLGYYSRARNLHNAAKNIVSEHQGEFPKDYAKILRLKGVGEYTAAAIVSFAYDLPYAVVDGNVFRVLSRIFDISIPIDSSEGKKAFYELANTLLNKSNPSEHNQAIMEFGALQCTPTNPNCEVCPFYDRCLALRNNTIPMRPLKTTKTKIRKRYFHFLHLEDESEIVIQQRTEKDIWQNMYQFPLIELSHDDTIENMRLELERNHNILISSYKTGIKHILSHQHLHTTVWRIHVIPEHIRQNSNYKVILKKDLVNYPIPRIIDRYLEELGGGGESLEDSN
jgi:A/G-specific adenine glycosylase